MHYLLKSKKNNKIMGTMKNLKLIIIFMLAYFSFSIAYSACNFTLNLGDNIAKAEEIYGEGPGEDIGADPDEGIQAIIIREANSITCPSINLGKGMTEYLFLDNVLSSITIAVSNDSNNSESKKFLLFNYVQENYGKITSSGQSRESWMGFKRFEKNERIIVYRKMNPYNLLVEDLFITDKKYDEKIIEFLSTEEESEGTDES